MAKRTAWIGIISLFILLISLSVAATQPTITHESTVREGFDELLVTTPLGNYLFSEDGGTLKSVLITFSPYGSKVAELVAGTTTNADTFGRIYLDNAEFPFALRYQDVSFDYTMDAPFYTDTGAIVIEMRGEGGGITVLKRFQIEPDALYTLTAEIEISSSQALVEPINLVVSNYMPTEKGRQLTYMYDDERSTAQLAVGSYFSFQGVGLMDDEILFFLSPDETTSVAPFAELTEAGTTRRIGVQLEANGGTSIYRFTLYGGRRRYVALEAAGLENLDEIGIFGRLMVYVIRLLNWLYLKTGNYGWAIIIFTILMRIVLFPLMRKQYHSMARIQQIQPRLKRIQARYKDNKEEMQKKTLEIYRKEKVNPMSGCLPMVIQLPIIIVIWRALLYASEQIHLSPGFLWVPDLSLPDPYFILVIVTTLIMMLQQYFMSPMTSDAAGPQKYMGYFMPLMMGVLLWKFPSGLWLYYLLTTAAQVGQQAFVNWEMARASAGQVTPSDDDFIDVDGEPTTESDDGDTA